MQILIPEWRQAWKFLSVQVAVLSVAWGSIPAPKQEALLEMIGFSPAQIPAVVGALVIIFRLIAQPNVHGSEGN